MEWKLSKGPASAPAPHYHVVFNDGVAQDHWTFAELPKAEQAAQWWNGKPRNAGQVATIRTCMLPEDACKPYRVHLSCTSCVGRA